MFAVKHVFPPVDFSFSDHSKAEVLTLFVVVWHRGEFSRILGHTKLLPWSSNLVFENKERALEIFIFVHFFFFFHNLMHSKSLEIRAIFVFIFIHKIFIY